MSKVKINVSAFGAKMPNKLGIANMCPPNCLTVKNLPEAPNLRFLVPIWTNVAAHKAGRITWAEFTLRYREQIEQIDVVGELQALAEKWNVDEITLCCFEAAADEHCHRKILYDYLPEDMRGERK